MENTLLDSYSYEFLPSEIAESSLYLAMKILQKNDFKIEQPNNDCISFILKLTKNRKYVALEKKYNNIQFKKIDKFSL